MRLWRKRKRCVSHMLACRRSSLGFSKVYCDFTKRWLLAWNQNKHITYYILHITCTNSKISIGSLYIRPHIVWWHQLNHCAALVHNLPTYISVRASVWRSIRQLFWRHYGFWTSNASDSRTFLFPSCLADSSCMVEAVEFIIYLSIYLHFIYSWQLLIIYYNRFFFSKK